MTVHGARPGRGRAARRAAAALVAALAATLCLAASAAARDARPAADAQSPFVLQDGVGLAEQYGYAPAYTRNVPAFDAADQAYVRSRTAAEAPTSYVHTLVAGEWLRLDFSAALRAAYPGFAGTVGGGGTRTDRIVFDRQDRAYNPLVVRLDDGSTRNVLLVSQDHCRTWKAFELPPGDFATEQWVGHNEIDGPPFMAFWRPSFPQPAHRGVRCSLWVTQPRLEGEELVIPPLRLVTNECLSLARVSGGASFAVTRGGFTYFVWPEAGPLRSRRTPNMIAVYDHRTGLVGEPRRLFATPPGNDPHIKPGICLDSRGYLHVVAGSHGTAVLYRRSLAPGSIDRGWTPPEPVLTTGSVVGDDPAVQRGRQTYNAFVCDSRDALHLVTRQWRRGVDAYFGGSRYGALVHQSRPANGPWGEPTLIVVPAEAGYSIYYHKLALDHHDRLFLTCSYSGGSELLADKERAAAMTVLGRSVTRPGKYRRRMLLVSGDGGATWRFAADADLAAPGDPELGAGAVLRAATSATPPAALSSWRWVTPQPQGAQLTALDFVDRRRGWAVGTHGTILRTVDGGRSWTAQASHTTAGLYGIAAHDELSAWAVGADGLVLHTRDGGATWRRQEAGTAETLFAVTALSRRAAFAVGSHGVARATDDGGRTWVRRPSNSHEALWSVAFTDDRHGFICGGYGHLLATGDGGRSWHMRPTYTHAALHALSFADRAHGVAVGSSGTVLVTHDGGRTWARGRSRVGVRLHAVRLLSPKVGWASGAGGQFLTTDDGGRSWTRQSLPVTGTCGALAFAGGRIWTGGASGAVCRSDDGGRSWRRLTQGPTRSFSSVAAGPSAIWVAGQAGTLLRSGDDGASWATVDAGIAADLRAVAFAGGEAWTVGAGGAVAHSADAGDTWTPVTAVGTSGDDVVALGGGRARVVGDAGRVASTTDGGASWQSVDASPEDLLCLEAAGDLLGWAGGGAAWGEGRAVVARTTDGGASWAEAVLPAWGRVRDLDFVDALAGWAAVEDWGADGDYPRGSVFVTQDGGASWTAQAHTTSPLLAVRMDDALRGVACGEDGTVLVTADGGATWTPQDAGTDGNLRALAFRGGRAWMAGDDGAVLTTAP